MKEKIRLVQVSEEFELIEFKLTGSNKMRSNLGKNGFCLRWQVA